MKKNERGKLNIIKTIMFINLKYNRIKLNFIEWIIFLFFSQFGNLRGIG